MAHTWKELHRTLGPSHPPCGAPLPAIAHLHAGSKPRLVSVLRPPPAWLPCVPLWGSGGVCVECMATTCLCQNCWWAEHGSEVARLEGDSFWKL